MNYFTAHHAVSIFPRSTFIDKVTYTSRDATDDQRRVWFKTYDELGLKVVTPYRSSTAPNRHEIAFWERAVGDRHTWVIPFCNYSKCGAQPIQIRVIQLTPFAYYADEPGVKIHAEVRLSKVSFEVLSYHYGVAANGAYLRIAPPLVYR